MHQNRDEPRRPEWLILSTFVRQRDGQRRLEQAFRILLDPARPLEALTPTEGSSDHACSHLRPRLDRPPGTRPND
jgi:hypothetical protein